MAYKYLTREGKEITFDVAEETSANDRERGWVLYRVRAHLEGSPVGYVKVSWIPRSAWDVLYPTVAHYLNTRGGYKYKMDTQDDRIEAMTRLMNGAEGNQSLNIVTDSVFGRGNLVAPIESLTPKEKTKYEKTLLKFLTKRNQTRYESFKNFWLDKPMVDYSRADIQGQKIGAALYNHTAQWLGTTFGLPLWASSLQSSEAQRLWSVLTPNQGGHIGSENGRKFLSY